MGNKQMEIRFVKILMFFAMLNIKIKTEKITGNMTKIIKITDCLKPEKKEIFKMTYQSDSNLWFVTFKCVNDAIPLGLNNESIPLRSLYYCDKETNEYVRKNKGPRPDEVRMALELKLPGEVPKQKVGASPPDKK